MVRSFVDFAGIGHDGANAYRADRPDDILVCDPESGRARYGIPAPAAGYRGQYRVHMAMGCRALLRTAHRTGRSVDPAVALDLATRRWSDVVQLPAFARCRTLFPDGRTLLAVFAPPNAPANQIALYDLNYTTPPATTRPGSEDGDDVQGD